MISVEALRDMTPCNLRAFYHTLWCHILKHSIFQDQRQHYEHSM